MASVPTDIPGQRKGSAILPYDVRGGRADDHLLHGSPQLRLYLGRDKHSSGVSVWLATPTGGQWPSTRLLFAERWSDPLPGEYGMLEIAISALQARLAEIQKA